MAVTRGAKLVYFQALGTGSITPPVLQDLNCIQTTLTMQGVMSPAQQIVLWLEVSPSELTLLQSGLHLPLRQVEQSAPKAPALAWKLTPPVVSEGKRARERRGWWMRGIVIAAALYFLFAGWLVTRLFMTSLKVEELRHWQADHAQAIALVHDTAATWKELGPAVDENSYPLELLLHVTESIPADQLHLTLFEAGSGHLPHQGRGQERRRRLPVLGPAEARSPFRGLYLGHGPAPSLAETIWRNSKSKGPMLPRTRTEKLLLALLALIIIGGGSFYGCDWLSKKQSSLSLEYAQLRADRAETEVDLQKESLWAQRKAWVQDHQPAMDNEGDTQAQMLQFVQKGARDHNLEIVEQNLNDVQHDAAATCVNVSIKVKGSMQSICQWLAELQKPESFYAVSLFSLKADQGPEIDDRYAAARPLFQGGFQMKGRPLFAIGALLLPMGMTRADEAALPGPGFEASHYQLLWTKSPFTVESPGEAPAHDRLFARRDRRV